MQAFCCGTVMYCQSYGVFWIRGANNGISEKGGAAPPASTNNILYPSSINLAVKVAPAVPAPTE